MNHLVRDYLAGLKKAYIKNNGRASWEHFETTIRGAKKGNIDKIKQLFPNVSDSLIELLNFVDGTYWKQYANEEITFYILGSDVLEYPYYLLSSHEIIENKNQGMFFYSDYLNSINEDDVLDYRISRKKDAINWLHFSDCMNNGGTSQLFIDFSPSEKGEVGQVVRFLHDPDEFKVIAQSFEDYLKMLMKKEYNFINEYTID